MGVKAKRLLWNLLKSSPLLVAGLVGFAGAGVSIAHELGLTTLHVSWELHVALVIVALLALALGIERFTRFEKIEEQFGAIQKTLSEALPTQELVSQINRILQQAVRARLLTGIEVYEETIRLITAAEQSIKALVYEGEAADSGTVSDAIANHLEHHHTVSFYLVLVVNWELINDQFWEIHGKRYDVYKRRHVEKQVHRYILKARNPLGFDTLIIDDTHLGISFSPVTSADQSKQVGLRLLDQRAIVGPAKSWFDNHFLMGGAATGYEHAEEQWRAETSLRATGSA